MQRLSPPPPPPLPLSHPELRAQTSISLLPSVLPRFSFFPIPSFLFKTYPQQEGFAICRYKKSKRNMEINLHIMEFGKVKELKGRKGLLPSFQK